MNKTQALPWRCSQLSVEKKTVKYDTVQVRTTSEVGTKYLQEEVLTHKKVGQEGITKFHFEYRIQKYTLNWVLRYE